jgi:hypothetical protein
VELPGLRELLGRYRQSLTSASYLGLLALAFHPGLPMVRAACLVLVSIIGFLAWASTYQRARAVADVATSRIGSAAQGYAEVVGRASADPRELLMSPFSGAACVWYRYRVYSKDNTENKWREIDSGTSDTTFELSDASGVCRVDPEHAEVVAPERRVTYQGGNKQVEELLRGTGPIYVLGEFSTLGGTGAAMSVDEDVSLLLASWKRDPVQLKRRFDLDGNGEIDLREWEMARRLAIKTVERQQRDIRSIGEVHMMRAPTHGGLFLISALPPATLRRRYLLWSFFHLGVALVALRFLA